jgi:predicted aconitase
VHLDANRQATLAVVLPPAKEKDYQLLGWDISKKVNGEVPLLCGARPTFDEVKRLALAINSSGNVPLFKMQRNPTPPSGIEAIEVEVIETGPKVFREPDLVVLGCPHMSEQDINRWSKRLEGRPRSRTEAWFFTSHLCIDKCPVFGAVLRSRGKIFVDACPLSLKMELKGKTVACESPSLVDCLTDAGIIAHYAPPDKLLSFLTKMT